MSAKIKLNAASGGGSFSLQAPSSSSNNRVFTLPDVADTTMATVNGITTVDSWSITSNFSQSAGSTDVTANWQRNYAGSTNWGILGSAVTESSGVFSFPITGIYLLQFNFHGRGDGSAQSYVGTRLLVSQNAGVAYGQVVFNYSQVYTSQAHFNMSNAAILNVTSTSNVKFKFNTEVQSDSIWFGESSSPKIGCGFYVIRLGDT